MESADDAVPIDNHVHDAHSNTLSLYWKQGVDVLAWLAETSGEPHQLFMRRIADHHAALQSGTEPAASPSDDPLLAGLPKALPTKAASASSSQHAKSLSRSEPKFNETSTTKAGHRVQVIRELQTIPVICAADTTKVRRRARSDAGLTDPRRARRWSSCTPSIRLVASARPESTLSAC